MSFKEVREMHFTCDGCKEDASLSKKENENTYPAGWFKVVFRGKTDTGRKEFDLCAKCSKNILDAIEDESIGDL